VICGILVAAVGLSYFLGTTASRRAGFIFGGIITTSFIVCFSVMACSSTRTVTDSALLMLSTSVSFSAFIHGTLLSSYRAAKDRFRYPFRLLAAVPLRAASAYHRFVRASGAVVPRTKRN